MKGLNRCQEIVALLKKKITFQEILPGEALPREELLAQQFAVSRASIREALGILKGQGYLESRRGKGGGTFVRNILEANEKDSLYLDLILMGQMQVKDLLNARLLIEPEAARLAALNASTSELQRLADHLEEANTAPHLEQRIESNVAFHNAIGQLSGNPFYAISIRHFMRFTHLFLKAVGTAMPDVHRDEDHRHLLHALQAQDPQLAYERMYVHVAHTKNNMIMLEKMFRENQFSRNP